MYRQLDYLWPLLSAPRKITDRDEGSAFLTIQGMGLMVWYPLGTKFSRSP
jgi:hypothetical protein